MLIAIVGVLLAPLGATLTVPAPVGELRATFVGNMAVHITDGRVAILTDFPYKSGAFGYVGSAPPHPSDALMNLK